MLRIGSAAGRVAELRSDNVRVSGTPFEDLGNLTVEEIRYDAFSRALWNADPVSDGASCTLATSASGPFACDLAELVQNSIDDGYDLAQMRLRLDAAGDGDGSADLVMFYITNSNTNEPGISELEVTVEP